MFCTLRPMNVPVSLVIAIAAFFAAAISAVVEFNPAGSLSEFAHSPAPTALSFWSPMWSPCVAEQDDVDGAEPHIVRAGHSVAGIVEYAYAARILRAVVRAKLARVRADRSDFHILSAGRSHCHDEGEGCASVCGLHVLLLWFGDPAVRLTGLSRKEYAQRDGMP
jgi:hypothetical protein